MLNFTLFKREMKGSWKLLLIIAAICTLYIAVIVSIYDPEMLATLDSYFDLMPELMAAMGLSRDASSLTSFLASYLYGFLLIVLPMIFIVLTANKLIAKYTDSGAMVTLLAAPVKRTTVVLTQMLVLVLGTVLLTTFVTLLEIVICAAEFATELDVGKIVLLNVGLLSLLLFVAGVSFFFSCLFSDTKRSVGFGAGIPTLMFVLMMLGNAAKNAKWLKYVTFFSLFDGGAVAKGDGIVGIIILFVCAVLLFASSVVVFNKKDLHI